MVIGLGLVMVWRDFCGCFSLFLCFDEGVCLEWFGIMDFWVYGYLRGVDFRPGEGCRGGGASRRCVLSFCVWVLTGGLVGWQGFSDFVIFQVW